MSGTNFFEFRERIVGKAPAARAESAANALSVSQLTAVIDRAVRAGVPASVWVKAEVSNLTFQRSSGHLYFTLKDASACIECAMWKSETDKLKFKPTDGMELLACGRVGVYGMRGRYQLYVTTLNPIGQGALELAFQQLRAKLDVEGLFSHARKKALPAYPLSIVMVTSRQTAALQDMLKVLRRFPFLRLMVFHVPVQGDGAAAAIAGAIKLLNRHAASTANHPTQRVAARQDVARPFNVDVILLARGGGSLEDLWQFNEESVARAIAESAIPIITGIGHEVDVSIADLVADYHAHTPTEAAQVVVGQWRGARDCIDVIALRSRRAAMQTMQEAKRRLDAVERHELFRRPLDRVHQLRQLLDDRQRSLLFAATRNLQGRISRVQQAAARLSDSHPRHRLNLFVQKLKEINSRLITTMHLTSGRYQAKMKSMDSQLRALSPQSVLNRGYSMTTLKKTRQIVRAASQIKAGDRMITQFAEGGVESVAEDQNQLPLFDS